MRYLLYLIFAAPYCFLLLIIGCGLMVKDGSEDMREKMRRRNELPKIGDEKMIDGQVHYYTGRYGKNGLVYSKDKPK